MLESNAVTTTLPCHTARIKRSVTTDNLRVVGRRRENAVEVWRGGVVREAWVVGDRWLTRARPPSPNRRRRRRRRRRPVVQVNSIYSTVALVPPMSLALSYDVFVLTCTGAIKLSLVW